MNKFQCHSSNLLNDILQYIEKLTGLLLITEL